MPRVEWRRPRRNFWRPPEDRDVIKRLTKHGNSLALVLDKPILELLKIDADTPLELVTDGSSLTVKPVRDPKSRAEFEKSWSGLRRKHASAFKRLAE